MQLFNLFRYEESYFLHPVILFRQLRKKPLLLESKKNEQHRFELLISHWDVMVEGISLQQFKRLRSSVGRATDS
jgi:hypothetical protein